MPDLTVLMYLNYLDQPEEFFIFPLKQNHEKKYLTYLRLAFDWCVIQSVLIDTNIKLEMK